MVKQELTRRKFVVTAAAAGVMGALVMNGCSASTDEPVESTTESTTESATEMPAYMDAYDLIVIGTGGAGMSAAITAFDEGISSILLIDKMGRTGGNSIYSSAGMNASETQYQAAAGIEDTNEQFVEDTYLGGYEIGNLDLINYMCNTSASSIDWLTEKGMILDNITITGGSTNKRCHRPTDGSPVGGYLVAGLEGVVDEDVNIDKLINFDALELMMGDDGAIAGIKASVDGGEDQEISAKAVIVATGGFGANSEMVVKYRPELEGFVTTNQPGATGDGMVMAEAYGAALVDMDQIQIHPTVSQSTSLLVTEGLRGAGGILVNVEGERFFNEMETRDKVSAAEMEQTGGFVYLIIDQTIYDNNSAAAKLEGATVLTKAETIEEMAEAIGCDVDTLQMNIDDYNAETTEGAADPFDRNVDSIAEFTAPYYFGAVAPGVHHCMGGIVINENTEVLDTEGNVLPGLFAAGETTGGIHGGNRLGGNAVCDIITFGRTAGSMAASYIMA